MNIVAKYPCSTHDAFVWRNSSVCQFMQNAQHHQAWLLADSGYPLCPFLMTPLASAQSAAEMTFNRRHSKTRNTIERAFGLLKMRFRCLHSTGGCLQSPPERCAQIVTACAVLHNMCTENSVPVPDDIGQSLDVSAEDDNDVAPANDNTGADIRRKLIDRFRQ